MAGERGEASEERPPGGGSGRASKAASFGAGNCDPLVRDVLDLVSSDGAGVASFACASCIEAESEVDPERRDRVRERERERDTDGDGDEWPEFAEHSLRLRLLRFFRRLLPLVTKKPSLERASDRDLRLATTSCGELSPSGRVGDEDATVA